MTWAAQLRTGKNTASTASGLFVQTGELMCVTVDTPLDTSRQELLTSRSNSCLEGALRELCTCERSLHKQEDTCGCSQQWPIDKYARYVCGGQRAWDWNKQLLWSNTRNASTLIKQGLKTDNIDCLCPAYSHQAARSPSRPAPSVCTSPPCVLSRLAAASGTSTRLEGTPIDWWPPKIPPLAQVRCPSRGPEEARWTGQSPPPRIHRRHKRGSGSPNPGCWL